jgi:D-3-phosphoglycerate dehydrogenase
VSAGPSPVVVALGPVDPALVEPHLPEGARFVPSPTAGDLEEAAGAVVRAEAQVDRALLDRMPKIRVLSRTGVGVDRVDVAEATRRGIAVVVAPGAGTNAVAEGALAMMLHLIKRLRWSTECVAQGRWADRNEHLMGDLEGATLGVIGYGRIGLRVAHLGRAFGMTVLAHDPFLTDTHTPDQLVDLAELRRSADVLTLHLPLTADTYHLVDAAFLRDVVPGAVLINCGRGGLVDLDAAAAALLDGRLGGLGLDVFDPEPPPPHPIFTHENVVLSPHLMGLSAGATRTTFAAAARGVADVLAGRPPEAVANRGYWQHVVHNTRPLLEA